MVTEKINQRKIIKELKQNFDRSTALSKSFEVFKKVENLSEFANANTVMAYWSLADEVNTHDFVLKWFKSKTIILPVVKDNNLVLKLFTGMACMQEGSAFGILEPQNAPEAKISDVDFVIVPGMAFDLNGNRLGRGKGYYDRLLKDVNVYKVGVCYSFQILTQVHVCEYDVPMDLVIYA